MSFEKCMIKHVDDKHIMNIPQTSDIQQVSTSCASTMLGAPTIGGLMDLGSIFQHFPVVDFCWWSWNCHNWMVLIMHV